MKNKKIYFVDHTTFNSRYLTTDGIGELVKVSAGCRGRTIKENNHTAFDDRVRGLRLLTEFEVSVLVAQFNADEGWKRGDVEPDGTPILTK